MTPNSVVITALKQLLIEPLHDDAGICNQRSIHMTIISFEVGYE